MSAQADATRTKGGNGRQQLTQPTLKTFQHRMIETSRIGYYMSPCFGHGQRALPCVTTFFFCFLATVTAEVKIWRSTLTEIGCGHSLHHDVRIITGLATLGQGYLQYNRVSGQSSVLYVLLFYSWQRSFFFVLR